MNLLDGSTCWRLEMRDLERRVTKLEQDAGHGMVFVTYFGNPEPMSLMVGGQRFDRMDEESWDEFKDRVQVTHPSVQLAIGAWRCPPLMASERLAASPAKRLGKTPQKGQSASP
jgi:hypothetical protein